MDIEPDVAPAHETRHLRARWLGGYRVDVSVRDGRFTIISDESLDDGGDDAGPMPSELLFASVTSCFGMAVVWAARKSRVELPDLEVTMIAMADRAARRYKHLEIRATSSLAASEPERFQRLLHLAEQVCWITRTIEPGIPMSVVAVAPAEAKEAAEMKEAAGR